MLDLLKIRKFSHISGTFTQKSELERCKGWNPVRKTTTSHTFRVTDRGRKHAAEKKATSDPHQRSAAEKPGKWKAATNTNDAESEKRERTVVPEEA